MRGDDGVIAEAFGEEVDEVGGGCVAEWAVQLGCLTAAPGGYGGGPVQRE